MSKIHIYTDGSYINSKEISASVAVVVDLKKEEYFYEIESGIEKASSDSELIALKMALKYLYEKNQSGIIFSDFTNGVTLINQFLKNEFVKERKYRFKYVKEIKDLIEKNREKNLKIKAVWIRSHAGNKYNELAHSLAIKKAKEIEKESDGSS